CAMDDIRRRIEWFARSSRQNHLYTHLTESECDGGADTASRAGHHRYSPPEWPAAPILCHPPPPSDSILPAANRKSLFQHLNLMRTIHGQVACLKEVTYL